MPITASDPFKWCQYPAEVIVLCARWYLWYPLSYAQVKGQNRSLYRAFDSTDHTIEFLLTAKRDAAAPRRFLRRALRASATPAPRGIDVDKNRPIQRQ